MLLSGPVSAPEGAPGRAASTKRPRLDDALVSRGLAETRSRARALILAGDVLVNDVALTRAGAPVGPGDRIALKVAPRFVSRGGEKLDHALDTFAIDVSGRRAADFGASTGGFTDCLLQRGAARVYAIDVGYGQIAQRLRDDPRVVVMDRSNVRHLETLPEKVDLVVIDVSFIGLRLVLPAALKVLARGGSIVALVKPQFEAGKGQVGRGGVVRDPETHRRILEQLFVNAEELDLGVVGLTASPLRGPAGNIEFLARLAPDATSFESASMIEVALTEAPPP
jgi:23S rRNA (cytidine1920-2'-O)/16S rRNA (cytidine1409-2'-O)-methyltransferase